MIRISRTSIPLTLCITLALVFFVLPPGASVVLAQSATLSGNPTSSFPSPPSLSNDPAKARLRSSDLPTELPRPENGAVQGGSQTATPPSSGNNNNTSRAGLGTPVITGTPASNTSEGAKVQSETKPTTDVKPQPADTSRPLAAPPTVPNRPEQKASDDKATQGTLSGLPSQLPIPEELLKKGDFLTSESGIVNTLKMVLTLTILSLAPAILMMTTSFVRIITVLSILRQALGTGQLPPNQVLTALSIFLTLLIMFPVWNEVYEESIVPYSRQQITAETAFQKGERPVRTFMVKQIERCGNTNDIWLFMRYLPNAKTPEFYDEVPWPALLPAFMLSELKTAFLIGFQIFIPFIVIDLVVAGVMVSMGMMMLPPVVVSLPFKLML
ncbi:MAG: flagellar type III secretion system pore protein FliP, partial [Planctomycetia bacterium]|nr:flagellar type III secretion system pore protein FliP [Planctomycetia bacterium]